MLAPRLVAGKWCTNLVKNWILHKSLLGLLDSDSSMCSDGDGNNGGDEDCDSGESFSDEFISFPVVTASLIS